MSSFVEINLEDEKERESVQPGEYPLVVRSFEARENDNGQYLVGRFAIEGNADAKLVTHTFFLPKPDDNEDDRKDKRLRLKRFTVAVGYDTSEGMNLDALVGLRCNAILGEKKSEEYGTQNTIKRFLEPSL